MKKTGASSSKNELLTQEEEIELSKIIKAGNLAVKKLEKLGEIDAGSNGKASVSKKVNSKKPAAKEIQKLWDAAEKGRQAADRFAIANMRLVTYLARQYRGRGLSDQDLFQEGYLALVQSIKRFDGSKGIRFSTYASKWIGPGIRKAIQSQTKMIKLPAAQLEEVAHLRQIFSTLEVKLKRPPTVQEVSREMKLPASEVNDLLKASTSYISLEAESLNGAGTLGENIKYSQGLSAPDSVVGADTHKFFAERIYEVMGDLDNLDREVLEMRFGLGGNPPMTVHETAKAIKEKSGTPVTAARIRNIESKALRVLKDKAPDLEEV